MSKWIACAVLGLAAPCVWAETDCAALKQLKLTDTRITIAENIAPNPQWKYPPSLFNMIPGIGRPSIQVPFCRVVGVIEKEIGFEVWLPKTWNGRFEGVGNGGLSGAINYPAMGVSATRGFATASTDTGHKTEQGFFEIGWIAGHRQRVLDFAHRAHHLLAVRGKEIVKAYYGKPVTRAYYSGCSSGGWQGLTQAQRYPEDYDGIVAGAPAINFVRLQSRAIWIGQLAVKEPEGKFTPAAVKLLVDSAVAQCDGIDGLKDGLIDDPRKCDFDPAGLACTSGQSQSCLTMPQVKRAKALYGPVTSPGGMKLYAGPAYGSPLSVELLQPDSGSKPGDVAIIQMLAQKPSWDVSTFDPDKHIPALEKELGPTLDSMSPDLSAFQKRGGKLILYHGWADPLLSPFNTIDYYDSVTKRMGREQTDEFARLFMAPGMAHCRGGSGPDLFDAVDAMVKWVEDGKAPERIIATQMAGGKVQRTRPLCVYPQVAKYKGSGSVNEAASFECKTP